MKRDKITPSLKNHIFFVISVCSLLVGQTSHIIKEKDCGGNDSHYVYKGEILTGNQNEGTGTFYYNNGDTTVSWTGGFKNGYLHGKGLRIRKITNEPELTYKASSIYVNGYINGLQKRKFYTLGDNNHEVHMNFENGCRKLATVYYPSGKIKTVINYINDKATIQNTYYEKGGLNIEVNFINGEPSISEYYYENGSMSHRDSVMTDSGYNGATYSQGWKEGNDHVAVEGVLDKGPDGEYELHGYWKIYDEFGLFEKRVLYEYGVNISTSYYETDGDELKAELSNFAPFIIIAVLVIGLIIIITRNKKAKEEARLAKEKKAKADRKKALIKKYGEEDGMLIFNKKISEKNYLKKKALIEKYGEKGGMLIFNKKISEEEFIEEKAKADRQKTLIEKYGKEFGEAVYEGDFMVGMGKDAVQAIMDEKNDLSENSTGLLKKRNKWYYADYRSLKIFHYKNSKISEIEESTDPFELDMPKADVISLWGKPADEKKTVYKTKTKLRWYYFPRTTRQYTTAYMYHVDLENDLVVGWKELE